METLKVSCFNLLVHPVCLRFCDLDRALYFDCYVCPTRSDLFLATYTLVLVLRPLIGQNSAGLLNRGLFFMEPFFSKLPVCHYDHTRSGLVSEHMWVYEDQSLERERGMLGDFAPDKKSRRYCYSFVLVILHDKEEFNANLVFQIFTSRWRAI